MAKIRKIVKREFNVDGTDRNILRAMNQTRRKLSSSEIAKKVKYTTSGVRPRLDNLRKQGIIRKAHVGGMRTFKRTFVNPHTKRKVTKNIKAPRSIKWEIDLVKKKKK